MTEMGVWPKRRTLAGLKRAPRRLLRVLRRPPPITMGDLEARLASTQAEVEAAQALRYRVFVEEMGARPTDAMVAAQREFDAFDDICDHILVIDRRLGTGANAVVGTYRLLRGAVARKKGGFYTATEFDISRLLSFPGQALELGRSCVAAAHRTRPTIELMWRSIAAYVFEHDISIMFGCASLPGVDPNALAQQLSYLYHHHLAPPALRVRALPGQHVDMNILPSESIDPRAAQLSLPPLLKGYLRLGGFVGDGAVVDSQFNTTDVCIIVVTDRVRDKYYAHYRRQARKFEKEGKVRRLRRIVRVGRRKS